MNESIAARFEVYRRLLVESPAVSHFIVVKQRVDLSRGHVRIRAFLADGGLLEFSEYIMLNDDLLLQHEYSFHWQDAQRQLVHRWDNAAHYPHLAQAPHHIHHADGTIEGNPEIPTLAFVLRTIEQHLT